MIGAGYVGLVSGACFSSFGHTVYCVDNDESKIEKLKRGKTPIYEPRLQSLLKQNIKQKRLFFDTKIDKVLPISDVIFIAVDTPSKEGRGEANLSNLFSIIEQVKPIIKSSQVVVLKSTVPIGTNEKVDSMLNYKKGKEKIPVVSNPEFLREGSAIEDFTKPDRVVLGLSSEFAKSVMSDIYKPLYLRKFPILFTDPKSAELIKYASNAFLAMKVSFINELAALCEEVSGDITEVANGIGLDNRIGNKFLHAGPGYGGSCLPKDTRAFVQMGLEFGIPQTLVETVVRVNETTKRRMISKVTRELGDNLTGKVGCILGITFKPNTDDLREAPSLTIIPELQKKRCKVRVVDPKGMKAGEKIFSDIEWYDDVYFAVEGVDFLIILTEWDSFRALDLRALSQKMINPIFFDFRNIYSHKQVLEAGFVKYISIGRN